MPEATLRVRVGLNEVIPRPWAMVRLMHYTMLYSRRYPLFPTGWWKCAWKTATRCAVLPGTTGSTAAKVRMLIESRDAHDRWGTVGVSHDIINASWQALVDGINYKLYKDEHATMESTKKKNQKLLVTARQSKIGWILRMIAPIFLQARGDEHRHTVFFRCYLITVTTSHYPVTRLWPCLSLGTGRQVWSALHLPPARLLNTAI